MEIDGETYLVGIYLAAKPGLWNWMANVSRAKDGGYRIESRLRLEMDDKLGLDSIDKKFWQDFTAPPRPGLDDETIIKEVKAFRSETVHKLCLFHLLTFREDISGEIETVDLDIGSSDQNVILEKMEKVPYFNITRIDVSADPSLN